MSMSEWAKREVEIACKREREGNGTPEGECDYGCACYDSALRAFESLMGDGYSGCSIMLTKHILNRLIDGKPLTPIEDTDDIWNDRSYVRNDDFKSYQCKRMSSLFKDIHSDGTITYSDVDRIVCFDIHNPDVTYHNGLVRSIIEELYPITMPYMPKNKPYMVCCEDFLTDPKNGYYDTLAIYGVTTPEGEYVAIDRYFKDGEESMIEIDEKEFTDRKFKHFKRIGLVEVKIPEEGDEKYE